MLSQKFFVICFQKVVKKLHLVFFFLNFSISSSRTLAEQGSALKEWIKRTELPDSSLRTQKNSQIQLHNSNPCEYG